jgi:hypothetical protein
LPAWYSAITRGLPASGPVSHLELLQETALGCELLQLPARGVVHGELDCRSANHQFLAAAGHPVGEREMPQRPLCFPKLLPGAVIHRQAAREAAAGDLIVATHRDLGPAVAVQVPGHDPLRTARVFEAPHRGALQVHTPHRLLGIDRGKQDLLHAIAVEIGGGELVHQRPGVEPQPRRPALVAHRHDAVDVAADQLRAPVAIEVGGEHLPPGPVERVFFHRKAGAGRNAQPRLRPLRRTRLAEPHVRERAGAVEYAEQHAHGLRARRRAERALMGGPARALNLRRRVDGEHAAVGGQRDEAERGAHHGPRLRAHRPREPAGCVDRDVLVQRRIEVDDGVGDRHRPLGWQRRNFSGGREMGVALPRRQRTEVPRPQQIGGRGRRIAGGHPGDRRQKDEEKGKAAFHERAIHGA